MNRAERRRAERGHKAYNWVEYPSPKQLKQGTGWFRQLEKVYRQGNDYVVMTRPVQTEWGEIIHATISTSHGGDVPWAEKQRIKNELFGPDAQAIEVFPKESELVDAAPMYHLWVLPTEMKIPFTLKE
ncbi:DUF7694 domain-containing protein [Evansella tamaricis]|uniref:DUF7694 domain-containing protein n=1 Tax=Evansella tamaricis TaxID=2069301 RepID=A0ABS6JBN4_9BACI|nr:hypothetical protein [Evansella tamaricis]MBU9711092.1 hypothetical protein [Evansella tamaricis]